MGPILIPNQIQGINPAQIKLLDRIQNIAMECHQKLTHVMVNRLSNKLFDYTKETGTGLTPKATSTTSETKEATPHIPKKMKTKA